LEFLQASVLDLSDAGVDVVQVASIYQRDADADDADDCDVVLGHPVAVVMSRRTLTSRPPAPSSPVSGDYLPHKHSHSVNNQVYYTSFPVASP